MSATNGKVHLLGDHKPPKPTHAEAARSEAVKVVEHYLAQVPGYVGALIESALLAYDAGRRDEFAAWVAGQPQPEAYAAMLTIFGPRKPMPEQPEVES